MAKMHMTLENRLILLSCFVALFSGCAQEPSVAVARWKHFRALDAKETNEVVVVSSRTELSAESKKRAQIKRERTSVVTSELEMFAAPEIVLSLSDALISANADLANRRKEVIEAFKSIRFDINPDKVPVVTVEARAVRGEIALTVLRFWATEFQKFVFARYERKYNLEKSWIEAECRKAETSGVRDVELIRNSYMRGLENLRQTLHFLDFYVVEPPHIVNEK